MGSSHVVAGERDFGKEITAQHKDCEARYELYAICVHLGSSMQSGHYIAYVNAATSLDNERWYTISDSHVSKCSRKEVLEAEAYIAFYRREGLVADVSESEPEEKPCAGDGGDSDSSSSSD